MKKMASIFIAFVMIFTLIGCDSAEDHVGEAKTPSGSEAMKGRQYQEVVEEFKEKGFTNIQLNKLEDLITGWITKEGDVEKVSVGGDEGYSPDKWVANGIAVIITYHAFPEKEESSEPASSESASESSSEISDEPAFDASILERSFPKENAKRAAVVAITNAYATDVFMPDGNNYDASKFHNYSDVSGDFMKIADAGTWSVKDDHTWAVDRLLLKTTYGTIVTAKLNVRFDGTNYIISNISGTLGNDGASAENKVDISEKEADKNAPYLTVSPKLIEIDRDLNTDNVDSDSPDNTKWANSLFSSWDGSCSALNKIIKKQLNDEKSFKHIETTSIDVSSEAIKKDVSEILTKANVTATIEIGDVIIITEFSAKNSFNATIKNTAYALASHKTKDIELLDIL